MGICTNASPEVDGVYNASLTRSHSRVFTEAESRDGSLGRTGQSRGSLFIADDQHQLFPVIGLPLTSESSQERGIIGQLLQQAGLVLDEKTRLQILEKKIDLRGILKAGLKALSHETLVDADCSTSYDGREGCATNSTKLRTDKILVVQNANKEYMASVPDIPRNNIRIKQVLFVAACVANASSLGLSLDGLNCDSAESPFFRNSVSELAATAILGACLSDFLDLKTHLRPCATQLMHRHHPYIDVLPFPTFRERLIKLACAKEPMIDEDELCKDLENDGLICWGSSLGGGSPAMGSGAPWDIRSWEAQGWFMKKWWILIGGVEGEIYKQTQWWCEMRGERSCYPW
ncbi:uncharacterized protein K444DRAFT_542879 [Hyaloscypha bicolor E]|uniref:Uncharacterized protein n=1 Tax=Hyaloscypha bicolor E TaxID=1095630 RepID=A0A2J6SQ40_9HELO|nr:uncharacterized protein K444DRAFT_542879 [Hyaloscypha bicolor E]PMD52874.1 hypothetical protein K444DRAFT_542879 [Hyaloscypha bicolor E]